MYGNEYGNSALSSQLFCKSKTIVNKRFSVTNDSVSLEKEKERGCKLTSEAHNYDPF